MAMVTSVPPRAYTREILTTAFNWLQTQPESVRAKAATPDALVGLYMQATRGANTPLGFDAEAPVSSQAFMSDLKNLAEGLKEFDDSRLAKAVPPPSSSKAQLGYPQETERTSPPATKYSAQIPMSPAPVAAAAIGVAAAASILAPEMAPAMAASLGSGLNERSLQMLREVQLALNLTSETETMNMMIALAHKSLKSLLA